MNPREFLTVALRIMGLWFLVQAVETVGKHLAATAYFFVVYAEQPNERPTIPGLICYMCVEPTVRAAIGIALLRYASRIAHRFYPKTDEPRSASVGSGDVYRVASCLLGVYVLLQAVQPTAHVLVGLARHPRMSNVDPRTIVEMVQACVFFLVGMGLVFGARGISRFLASLRYDPDSVPAQQFGIRLLLFVVLVCAFLMGMISYLVR